MVVGDCIQTAGDVGEIFDWLRETGIRSPPRQSQAGQGLRIGGFAIEFRTVRTKTARFSSVT